MLPEDAQEREDDYVMLSDIFPKGRHSMQSAGLLPGESIAIYGAGPVGLMAAHSVMIKGASQVFLVDSQPNRLKLAAQLGATPINSVEKEAVDQILNLTQGKGTDRGCECVGYQCCDRHGHNANHLAMNNLVASTKTTGGIGVVGMFCSARPGRRKRAGEKARWPSISARSGSRGSRSAPAKPTLNSITVASPSSFITVVPNLSKSSRIA
jgi:glutathione-independent formaldehyde dehydrogenase